MKFLVIQHVDFEGPANIAFWIQSKSHDLVIIKPYLGDQFPPLDSFDNLIVMGGPMSVHDDSKYPWLTAEKEFILNVIRHSQKPILGVCLGSQLIAYLLGAEIFQNLHHEIGWHQVALNQIEFESQFGILVEQNQKVFHWHGDAFHLPHGTVALASSEATKVQGFIYQKRVLGLLFHLEMNKDSLEKMLSFASEDLRKIGPYVSNEVEIRSESTQVENNQVLLNKILSSFFQGQ